MASAHDDIEAMVKFFDREKGYGFVRVSDGSPDAYLPAAVIERSGQGNLEAGTVIFCEIIPGQRGPEVSAIHYVDRPLSRLPH
ncbi:cold-shock protein [Arenibaculum pallidiluteum]|uniref:cold-shock protein n=1 Tax=Arenibaculum pallidiluteum TaxID=2812559 RepID=UPI001F3DE1AF|nr:cold shock domain-containing protein [Arenibaculum pallidiluteum]